ncbi:pyridoxal kinase isoform X1 [Chelonus insularis]|uniref:pyridoxal kinase isoform X1 n=1 Tax=Chelonus insularis TaxID=460826 RepID=UPI00158B9E6F|nr:pyridoxal kinase isoform X1 [Chelonus insularis]XP_034950519.1 pyridoxal kinase isoform X1 [Chelonus insularis]XP_034950520.1 pyridoxal kinase isoform X1 [Chelonus insularis]
MDSNNELHVLSIQSHVVSGYVGNKSATFPLQLLGFEVDAINSVQLSNHTGYKTTKGDILDDQNLSKKINKNNFFKLSSILMNFFAGQLMEGLVANDLHHYSHLLTGYVGSASFLKYISKLVSMLKAKNPKLIYLCDPVMGDNGKLYIPEELVEIYKKEIVPLADIITPNQFELELLTNRKIHSLDDVKDAINYLYKQGPKTVVISSTDINDRLIAVAGNCRDKEMITINIPKIPINYTGSGDLFAALFLAHSTLEKDLKSALEKTINTLHSILLKTYEYAAACKDPNMQDVRKKELKLIQSKNIIENPPSVLKATYY